MNAWLLPLGTTAATGLATYLSCLRPMRRARRCHPGMAPRGGSSSQLSRSTTVPAAGGEEIRRLTEEVRLLRHEFELRESTGSTR